MLMCRFAMTLEVGRSNGAAAESQIGGPPGVLWNTRATVQLPAGGAGNDLDTTGRPKRIMRGVGSV